MNLNGEVGETAGKVWNLLNENGSQTLDQMRKKLRVASDLLNFAVGWLAREDKISIVREKRTCRVQLK